MSPDTAGVPSSFDVVIVGGGNAGISAAARLIRRNVTDVAVVEPQAVHTPTVPCCPTSVPGRRTAARPTAPNGR